MKRVSSTDGLTAAQGRLQPGAHQAGETRRASQQRPDHQDSKLGKNVACPPRSKNPKRVRKAHAGYPELATRQNLSSTDCLLVLLLNEADAQINVAVCEPATQPFERDEQEARADGVPWTNCACEERPSALEDRRCQYYNLDQRRKRNEAGRKGRYPEDDRA